MPTYQDLSGLRFSFPIYVWPGLPRQHRPAIPPGLAYPVRCQDANKRSGKRRGGEAVIADSAVCYCNRGISGNTSAAINLPIVGILWTFTGLEAD